MNVERLFASVYPGLVRFLYRRLGDRDVAEDLAQEAFIRLVDKQPAHPEGWLFVVAANLARDHGRRAMRGARRLQLLANDAPQADDWTAERQLVQDEQAAAVRAALARLSERDVNLLLLHQEGLSYAQLAAVVEVAPSSIAPLLARARARLLKALRTLPKELSDDRASA